MRKDPKVAAPVRTVQKIKPAKARKLELAPVRATASADAQRIWADHERWLSQAAPKAQAA